MSYPPQQPPAERQQPPAAWPAPTRPPIDRQREHRKALLIGGGILAAAALGFAALMLTPRHSASDDFSVELTSCSASGGVATAGLVVKNISDKPASVTVAIEYRDASGARLDTDKAYIRNVQPGDTVRHDEDTILDATPGSGLTCKVTGIS